MAVRHSQREKLEPVAKIVNGMQEHFSEYKRGVGIDDDYLNIPEDDTSDRIFQVLHPAIKRSFKDIVNSNKLYTKMKSIIKLHNNLEGLFSIWLL